MRNDEPIGGNTMIFRDRKDSGRQLAGQLTAYANLEDVVVLGIPRGGVPVAFEIASNLHLPLDVFLSRKLGVPGHEELAFGAVAAGDGRFLDQEIIKAAKISAEQIESITEATRQKLDKRAQLYRGGRPPLEVAGETVILVDDGIATGASIYAAIRALRHMHPKSLVVAVPVAPISTYTWLQSIADELIVLYTPRDFNAVGQFYGRFSQVPDEDVVALLERAAESLGAETFDQDRSGTGTLMRVIGDSDPQEVSIDLDGVTLEGTLSLPNEPKGIVIFAHGSGSGRHSPRNRYVAEVLQSKGLATLLFDLLTDKEESFDRRTGRLRFDISLLAERLIGVTEWVTQSPALKSLAVGYFGASTGAGAAIVAAASLPGRIGAIVSRGGRPDLAGDALGSVDAPTLLIVGGLDEIVVALNRQALAKLRCPIKQLAIVPGARHLFEESGTLESVAQLAADWMAQYLGQAQSRSGENTIRLAQAT
jgi:putative phosphoribosyl transferase